MKLVPVHHLIEVVLAVPSVIMGDTVPSVIMGDTVPSVIMGDTVPSVIMGDTRGMPFSSLDRTLVPV